MGLTVSCVNLRVYLDSTVFWDEVVWNGYTFENGYSLLHNSIMLHTIMLALSKGRLIRIHSLLTSTYLAYDRSL